MICICFVNIALYKGPWSYENLGFDMETVFFSFFPSSTILLVMRPSPCLILRSGLGLILSTRLEGGSGPVKEGGGENRFQPY